MNQTDLQKFINAIKENKVRSVNFFSPRGSNDHYIHYDDVYFQYEFDDIKPYNVFHILKHNHSVKQLILDGFVNCEYLHDDFFSYIAVNRTVEELELIDTYITHKQARCIASMIKNGTVRKLNISSCLLVIDSTIIDKRSGMEDNVLYIIADAIASSTTFEYFWIVHYRLHVLHVEYFANVIKNNNNQTLTHYNIYNRNKNFDAQLWVKKSV